MAPTNPKFNHDLFDILQTHVSRAGISADMMDKLIELLEGKPETDFSPADQAVLHSLRWNLISACQQFNQSSGEIVIALGDDDPLPTSMGCDTLQGQHEWEVRSPTDASLALHLRAITSDEQPPLRGGVGYARFRQVKTPML